MRGSPLANSIVMTVVKAVLSAIPAKSILLGENPPRPATTSISSKVSAAPTLPAGSNHASALPGTMNIIMTTPKDAPELIPNTSGLAIGLPVNF
ncbi:Uncharacterised protein [Yersinia massiliensis]|nr:Uncharacterised protein [Yersinia massiliensis]